MAALSGERTGTTRRAPVFLMLFVWVIFAQQLCVAIADTCSATYLGISASCPPGSTCTTPCNSRVYRCNALPGYSVSECSYFGFSQSCSSINGVLSVSVTCSCSCSPPPPPPPPPPSPSSGGSGGGSGSGGSGGGGSSSSSALCAQCPAGWTCNANSQTSTNEIGTTSAPASTSTQAAILGATFGLFGVILALGLLIKFCMLRKEEPDPSKWKFSESVSKWIASKLGVYLPVLGNGHNSRGGSSNQQIVFSAQPKFKIFAWAGGDMSMGDVSESQTNRIPSGGSAVKEYKIFNPFRFMLVKHPILGLYYNSDADRYNYKYPRCCWQTCWCLTCCMGKCCACQCLEEKDRPNQEHIRTIPAIRVKVATFICSLLVAFALSVVVSEVSANTGTETVSQQSVQCFSGGSSMTVSSNNAESSGSTSLSSSTNFVTGLIVSAIGLLQDKVFETFNNAACRILVENRTVSLVIQSIIAFLHVCIGAGWVGLAVLLARRSGTQMSLYVLVFFYSELSSWIFMANVFNFLQWCVGVLLAILRGGPDASISQISMHVTNVNL